MKKSLEILFDYMKKFFWIFFDCDSNGDEF